MLMQTLSALWGGEDIWFWLMYIFTFHIPDQRSMGNTERE